MKRIKLIIFTGLLVLAASCKQYLDVVPDNVATIDNAFSSRVEAERYLYTCYSYLPDEGNVAGNPAFNAGDEFWFPNPLRNVDENAWQIARGNQNIVQPYMNFWAGDRGGKALYKGIRDCNIFLENVDKVVDLQPFLKTRWIAEVKFLKAYYHFYLFRMYGPIPVIDVNAPITATADEVQKPREPVDKVVQYIAGLLDEAAADLPLTIQDGASELGRVTRPVALAIKARLRMFAASPLFNGNTDFSGFKSKDGTLLFNSSYDPVKWDSAVVACREAIASCEAAGIRLYHFTENTYNISDTTRREISLRGSVTERWNTEVIWGASNSRANNLQQLALARIDPARGDNLAIISMLAPTMKMAELFYSNNGVPITEDKDWNYAQRNNLRIAKSDEKYYIKEGYQTAELNFDREPRFYSSLGFDGGIWWMASKPDDKDTWMVQAKIKQAAGRLESSRFSITGYWPKKLVNKNLVINDGQTVTLEEYAWPIVRLADLYLYYAEALNETAGPGPETYKWIDLVRERAGLKTVAESWSQHSNQRTKYQNKEGLREIIQQERLIELAFEGSRFWDLRRWKKAAVMLNSPVFGWDVEQIEASAYYRTKLLYAQKFVTPRDYFWPIQELEMTLNSSLVQNPGW